MISRKARKQRKRLYNAPLHKKRKWTASHLAENLLLKYDRRSIPVVKGDTVKVMRGSFKGHEDKVSHVDVRNQLIEIEGVTIVKTDGKKIAKSLHASTLLITKLNLTDKWRRDNLEKRLSADTKKEIEREAQEQLKEKEEAKRRAEEAKAAEERAAKEAEKAAEEQVEEPIPPEKEQKEESEVPPEEPAEKSVEDEKKPSEQKKTPPKKKQKTTTKKNKENKA
jgi:large subunit ribosomal protein L24